MSFARNNTKEFKNHIYDSTNNFKKIKPVLDKTIDEISSNLKIQKKNILKIPSSSIIIITNNNKNQILNFLEQI